MLKSLLIRNYALIEHLEMTPSAGLNIITGETGAGKSIMLGAIGLLLGNRADSKALLNAAEKCVIEAQFDIKDYALQKVFETEDIDYDNTCIIRREINAAGKSRSFVNDSPVTLDLLKKLGNRLVDVHSQHETLALGNSGFQLSIIDAFAANTTHVNEYKNIFKQYKTAQEKYEQLLGQATQEKAQLSFNSFLLEELDTAAILPDEQEQLEQKLKLLANAEDIKTKLVAATQLLNGEENNLLLGLQSVEKLLAQLAGFNPALGLLQQRLKGTIAELKDIQSEIEEQENSIEFTAEALPAVESRLSTIYTLQKKHGVLTNAELIALQKELQAKVSTVEHLDETLASLKKETENWHKKLIQAAETLTATRKQVMPRIVTEVEAMLKEVGIVNGSIVINHKPIAPNNTGADDIALLFSANKGIAPQELKNAASGGEFSRLMLCIKYLLADKTALPTIIFDEIETGVSGEIAMKVGKMMRKMAKSHQVISISHLPQIAAQGDTHYFVYKDNTATKSISKVRLLNHEDRVQEIAQMLSGAKPTASAIDNARELLVR